MRRQSLALLIALVTTNSFAVDVPQTYEAAKSIWGKLKNRSTYQAYMSEFTQFNNHFHLDEKDGCYTHAQGPVTLMLVISKPNGSEFAVIDRVFSNVNNAKSQCFKKTYEGVQIKAPPFLPFVLQMDMG